MHYPVIPKNQSPEMVAAWRLSPPSTMSNDVKSIMGSFGNPGYHSDAEAEWVHGQLMNMVEADLLLHRHRCAYCGRSSKIYEEYCSGCGAPL